MRNTYNSPIIPKELASIIELSVYVHISGALQLITIKERMMNVVIMMGKCIESNKNATKNILFL